MDNGVCVSLVWLLIIAVDSWCKWQRWYWCLLSWWKSYRWTV